MEEVIYNALFACAGEYDSFNLYNYKENTPYLCIARDIYEKLTDMGYKIVPIEHPQENESLYTDHNGE